MGRPLRNCLGEPALVRSRSHDIIKWISISLFSTEILFSVTKLAAIDWNGGMRDLGQKTTISDLWYCILNFRWQTEVMTLAEPMLAYNGLISGLWGFLMSWYRVCSCFSHWPVYRAFSPFPVCVHQGLSLPPGGFSDEGDVVPFRDVIRDKYLIKIQEQQVILLIIERGTHWWKFLFVKVNAFWDMGS